MVAEKPAMAEELAKNLSNNNFIKRQYYEDLGLDPSAAALEDYRNYGNEDNENPPSLKIFEFEYIFYGFEARVWMVATSGHIFEYGFKRRLTDPEQAFYYEIVDIQKNRFNKNLKCLPFLLRDVAEDSDAVVLCLDNDSEGEAIGFEVIDIVKDVIRTPPGGTKMDVIYR
uniref:DNA topoisomerase n=1 Tax=Panagrolaimus superbus TaxID=310955 RepID=A0A914YYE1_9BILA